MQSNYSTMQKINNQAVFSSVNERQTYSDDESDGMPVAVSS